MHTLRCNAELESERVARVIHESVLPDVKLMPARRSRVDIDRLGNNIQIEIRAEDVSALRASVSGVFRLLALSERVITTVLGDV
ncbi:MULTISPECIES: KEOPS complex subunit Pcc1 [unclassified Methanopyrus]|uniref:KEOPS complex subunit Pcc1 n=1 Tax=unclassified Methanopyrus TaxID=2684913 RepID=UPI000B4B1A77|nr:MULTISPECIES: KEOPS complex subunit Pcc1 [unclassified Methanopyrus]